MKGPNAFRFGPLVAPTKLEAPKGAAPAPSNEASVDPTLGQAPGPLKTGGVSADGLAQAEIQRLLGRSVQQAVRQVAAGLGPLRGRLDARRALDRSLDARDPGAIVAALRQVPAAAELLDKPSGSTTYKTIGDHTRAVLENLREGIRHRPAVVEHDAGDERALLRHLFLATALHDIGKGHSVEHFDHTGHQHAYTGPIVEELMTHLGYAPEVRTFVAAVIDHDLLAEASRGLVSIPSALDGLQGFANKAKLPLDVFMDFAEVFYIADASSYPKVRDKAFEVGEGGRLEPNRSLYAELRQGVAQRAAERSQR